MRATIILLAALTTVLTGSVQARTELYVSPGGSDAAEGTADAPLASLTGARDRLREMRASEQVDGHVHVILHGGTYVLAEPFELGPEDSGTRQSVVTYRAAQGERVVISGGSEITGWQRAADGSWSADVNGDWAFRQLFIRHEGDDWWQRRYRPHLGPFVIAGLTDSPAREGQPHRQSQIDFVYHPGDIEQWPNLGDVEVVALHDWSASRLRIADIDTERSVVTFTERPVYRIGHWWEGGRNPYYIENVGEALDQPGQWYHDRAEGTLTYLPLPGEELGSLELVASRLETLV
ncbi:MAG: hypothetical protein GF320_22990, partial [Armatimonadia bacterium]|nr:hypothetical protein [Armatimonadia bacterium]